MRWLEEELTNLHLFNNTFCRLLYQILQVSRWSADDQGLVDLRLTV